MIKIVVCISTVSCLAILKSYSINPPTCGHAVFIRHFGAVTVAVGLGLGPVEVSFGGGDNFGLLCGHGGRDGQQEEGGTR